MSWQREGACVGRAAHTALVTARPASKIVTSSCAPSRALRGRSRGRATRYRSCLHVDAASQLAWEGTVTRIKVPLTQVDVDKSGQLPAGLEVLQLADGQGPPGSAGGDRVAASELRPDDGLAHNL